MLEDLRKVWKIEDLRKKIIFTFLMLVLYRLVSVIPAPGISKAALLAGTSATNLPLLELVNMMTGNAFSQMTIMAMGITPYINASIIMQLLTIAIPALERLQNDESGNGREKIARITRYVTVGLAALQAIGLSAGLQYVDKSSWLNYVLVGLSMAGGSAFAMWLGERITEKGIGNGISLLIFVGIISNIFSGIVGGFSTASTTRAIIETVAVLALCILMTLAVTYVELGERRIPLNISKQTRGRRVYGGQNTRMTLKVVSVGVLPLIFAYSFMSFPGTIIQLCDPHSQGGVAQWWNRYMNSISPLYIIICALLIIAFTFFYSSISFDAKKQAESLQMQGATIPGQRGKNTYQYLHNTVNRLNLFAALFLAVLSTVPALLTRFMTSVRIPFSASSILIAVSVGLETIRMIQGEMSVRGIEMDMDKGGFM